jgi:hypothetical protein
MKDGNAGGFEFPLLTDPVSDKPCHVNITEGRANIALITQAIIKTGKIPVASRSCV